MVWPGSSTEQEVRNVLPPCLPPAFFQAPSRVDYPPRALESQQLSWLPQRRATARQSRGSGAYRTVPTASGQQGNAGGSGSSFGAPRSTPPTINFGALFKGISGIGLGIGAGGGSYLGLAARAHAERTLPAAPRKAVARNGKKRILIMMSLTGGGHKASAEALKAAFVELYGPNKYEIDIVDMWSEHTPAPVNQMPKSYSFLVKHSFLWWASYSTLQPRWVHGPYMQVLHALCARSVGEAFATYCPDLVVSVHPLLQHVPLRVLRSRVKAGLQPPAAFATVVTDFTTCHNTWFHKGVDKCFVATEFAKYLAKSMGLSDSQIAVHGLPIRPAFSKRLPARPVLRRTLGLDADTPAVLLVGGGEGMGALEDTVAQIAKQVGARCQLVVICGRNAGLLQRLAALGRPNGMRLLPCGFVDNIHEWMAACDVIVTKAGPGTIAEALIAGLPILLNGNIPCQEEGNIPYVVDNKVGAFETRPDRIASILSHWLGAGRAELAAMAARAKSLGKPEAVYNIVRDLAGLAESADKLAIA